MQTRRTFLTGAVAALSARGDELPFRTVDLALGASQKVAPPGGKHATVRVIGVAATHDPVRSAVRAMRVDVEVNGKRVTLGCGKYHLPVTVEGVQIDCPITRDHMANAHADAWSLGKDVRLRLWPQGSPWLPRGSMLYPAKQRWFATATQMTNEPAYLLEGERFNTPRIYYHSGLDIGGADAMVEVVAATDGVLVQVGEQVLKGHENSPTAPRYDVLYVMDSRGWYYRYSHLDSFAKGLQPGQKVAQGQLLGMLGKEGGSGGWSHLHFEIKAPQPSGKWGTLDDYAFLWEAYQRQYAPKLIAVARPHRVALVGEKVRLDGSRSWSAAGRIARYEWQLSDGSRATGATATRVYERPGTYSEILKITDDVGRTAYDFTPVLILDATRPERIPPSIHAAYHPTLDIRPGQPLTFKVRTGAVRDEGEEVCELSASLRQGGGRAYFCGK